MKNGKYEKDICKDLIAYLKQNNYEITFKPDVKYIQDFDSKDSNEKTIVKFEFALLKPTDERLEQEIQLFIATLLNPN